MVILDTDHLSIVDQDTQEGFNLGRRLAALPPAKIGSLTNSGVEISRWFSLHFAEPTNLPDYPRR